MSGNPKNVAVKIKSHEKTQAQLDVSIAFVRWKAARARNFFPYQCSGLPPGMGRFQMLNLGVLGYGLELGFWVVIAIIVSLTLTITLITTLAII